tara:strand:+ start:1019 stop:1306 length:288 start_codon:yes stop_codon:yes gene_type:complete
MDIFWILQNIIISLVIISLFHYIYVYLIDNFTEIKIKDPEIVHSNYNDIINTTNINNKTVHFENITNSSEDTNHDRNMEEELKIYLQQQINQQLN